MHRHAMFMLNEQRFVDFFHDQGETGMGYWVATAFLKDGRVFKQVVIVGGNVTMVRGHVSVPFCEAEIDRFVVTHDKWNW